MTKMQNKHRKQNCCQSINHFNEKKINNRPKNIPTVCCTSASTRNLWVNYKQKQTMQHVNSIYSDSSLQNKPKALSHDCKAADEENSHVRCPNEHLVPHVALHVLLHYLCWLITDFSRRSFSYSAPITCLK